MAECQKVYTVLGFLVLNSWWKGEGRSILKIRVMAKQDDFLGLNRMALIDFSLVNENFCM